jgi:ADP-heptose:LPS heptosyltransferase
LGLPLRQIIEINIWRDSDEQTFDVYALAAQISQCDLFISLVPWYSTAIKSLMALLSPTTSIGLDFDYLDVSLPSRSNRHLLDITFEICKYINPLKTVDQYVGPMIHPQEAVAEALKLTQRPEGTRLLVVHTDTKPEKCWAIEHWRQFLKEFSKRNPHFYVAIVGCNKYWHDEAKFMSHTLNCQATSLSTAFAITASADLFVGVDSCMLHAADLSNVPSVGLFGPTQASSWGFRVTRHFRHVVSPTTRMFDISVSDVLNATEDLVLKLGLRDR